MKPTEKRLRQDCVSSKKHLIRNRSRAQVWGDRDSLFEILRQGIGHGAERKFRWLYDDYKSEFDQKCSDLDS